MLRNTFAIVSGLFATMIVITFVELANARLFFPAPSGMDWTNKQAVAAFAVSLPIAALLVVLAGWLLGAFVGAAVAARLSTRPLLAGLVIGALVVAGTLLNSLEIPHPTWVILTGTLLPIPVAWLAAHCARPKLLRLPESKAWPKDAKAD
jgi:hypothetical protein